MKKLSFIIFTFCLLFASCNNDNDDNVLQEEGSQKLEKMYNELITGSLVNSQPCTDPKEWAFTAVNLSACGSDARFIVYSKKINTAAFLDKVKKYQEAKIAFDTKWKIVSVCDIIKTPTGVDCVDGKPTLTYNHVIY
ncbi:hypothetical protein AR687_17375 [Flavobacteriaceae bacterium CRH]|nr:hypothetical protein AR687_17375 [Flavobacteriaceae bacterium CRH]